MQKKTCSILTENCLILTFRDLSAICFHRIVLFYNHLRHSYRLISLFFQLWMQQRSPFLRYFLLLRGSGESHRPGAYGSVTSVLPDSLPRSLSSPDCRYSTPPGSFHRRRPCGELHYYTPRPGIRKNTHGSSVTVPIVSRSVRSSFRHALAVICSTHTSCSLSPWISCPCWQICIARLLLFSIQDAVAKKVAEISCCLQNLQQLLYLFLLSVRSTQFKSIGNLLFPGFHRTDGEFLPVDAGTCRDYLFSYIYPVKNGQPGDQHKRKDHHAPYSFLHIFAPVPPVFSLYYMDVEGVV